MPAIEKFDNVVSRIKGQQAYGISCYAFLSGILKNQAYQQKYNNSYAGHAIELGIRSVEYGLVMFCSRHWDEGVDYQSIPAARAHAGESIGKIIERHQNAFAELNIERDAQEFERYYKELSDDVDAALADPIRAQIRILRSETLAHLIHTSRDRKKIENLSNFLDMNELTIYSLLEFTKKTIDIGNKFIYLKERLSPAFTDRVKFQSAYYQKFWDNLPLFSHIEGPID